jgi:hypothetical protein
MLRVNEQTGFQLALERRVSSSEVSAADITETTLTHIQRALRHRLLVPSSNSTQEPEFSQALPDFASLHTGRLSGSAKPDGRNFALGWGAECMFACAKVQS